MFKAIWYGLIDAWLAIKRTVFVNSNLSFDTQPGSLVIYVDHGGRHKTIRISFGSLDAAVKYLDQQPHGASVVFKEGSNWTLVPNFMVPELRRYVMDARNALRRSKEGVSEREPAVNSKPAAKSALN